jgi:TctA family transporter
MLLLQQAAEALAVVFDPFRFLIIMLGVVLGLFIGVIPGIGGLVGMALLLPFTYAMDPFTALAFLIGMWAVTPTSDTIPSILLGVPGAAGSAATVMDGYPMARRGEAGRALGASYTASVIGGLFGAVLLGISIPILRPFMLAFGTPELLALCVLGLMLVAAVSQGAMLKGLVAASFGVLLASVGDEAQTGELRWTFDTLYLWDGLPLEALVLGLFAVPELIDLAASRKPIAAQRTKSIVRDQFQGVKDAIKNIRLVFQSSWLGVVLGSVPGLGGAAVDWIAYGSAARSVKDGTKTFGTGDVRGVIASEAANNSREGGALIPTIAFGIPGSATMAILLGAFIMHGIQPGPKLLSEQLDVTYTIVWSLILGNIAGVLICFAFVSQLAKMALIPAGILVPTVMSIVFVGAYQATRDIGDIIVLLAFSVLGWVMKRFDWARAPVLLGLVLGGLVEQYLFISTSRYGFDWLERPGVLAIFSLPVIFFGYRLAKYLVGLRRRQPAPVGADVAPEARAERADENAEVSMVDRIAVPAIWVAAAVLFVAALWTSRDWTFAARLMPQTVAVAGLVVIALSGIGILIRIRNGERVAPVRKRNEADPLDGLPEGFIYRRIGLMSLWVLSIFVGTLLIGLLPTMLLFMFLFMRIEGKVPLPRAALITAGMWIGMFVLFDQMLNVPWPQSYLGDAFPGLRRAVSGII